MTAKRNPFPTRKRPKVRRGDYVPYSRIEKTLEDRLGKTSYQYTQTDIRAMARKIQRDSAEAVEQKIMEQMEEEIKAYL